MVAIILVIFFIAMFISMGKIAHIAVKEKKDLEVRLSDSHKSINTL